MNSHISTLPPGIPALCDARGKLAPAAVGWSSRPRLNCAIPGNFGRRKRWNHWCITTPRWMLSLTLADLDLLGYGAAYFLDLDTGQAVAHTQLRPFALGCRLPNTPLESHSFDHPHLQIRVDEHPGRLSLRVEAPDLGGQPLHVALDVLRPAHLDSVNLVAPLPGGCFHASSRQLGLPASGSVQLGTRHYDCITGHSFAALDFGRGVWPFHSQWTRAAFAAPGGIAGNFGAGWTDSSGLTENALWFGGSLSKLDRPVQIEQAPNNPLAPWRLSTACRRVELTFTPRQLHQARPRLGLFYANTRQWFGRFDGVLRSPDGECVPVTNALGWLGATHARW
ncbi:DUF2804 domain-containing protein [Pseudomonas sp. JS3066]|jgi:hypothetical protein|uniref:DUF2804 domain-containing protein n=1 Tax=unclassified Pseudomonas TaxID=196821 RepID=UPI000EAA25E4|nr:MULTISPECIES: DUF2804 domain-containing protein [unclassified Pseudomonas]AYF88028.1 DUF2804 domain-containing protein [Pseudomonas sp. DY-1]MDH4654025.1 DUF2804 domain-containing protein [Pseudomonas sp. BN606]MRK23369.1 DUF2804 domain-containing protein [Pseudomonas sp. JG-B]WVK94401.1 DUF2804 domain-containing protein [Pseudomonas sp. JS3066]